MKAILHAFSPVFLTHVIAFFFFLNPLPFWGAGTVLFMSLFGVQWHGLTLRWLKIYNLVILISKGNYFGIALLWLSLVSWLERNNWIFKNKFTTPFVFEDPPLVGLNFFDCLWSVWLKRNNWIFRNKFNTPFVLLIQAQAKVSLVRPCSKTLFGVSISDFWRG